MGLSGKPLRISVDVDPADLAVNRRYRDSHTLTPEVRRAMQMVQGKVFDALDATPGWAASPTYRVMLYFTFSTMASDLDGPVKRTIDALELGLNMRKSLQGKWFNDNDICSLEVQKQIGTPQVTIVLFGQEAKRCTKS